MTANVVFFYYEIFEQNAEDNPKEYTNPKYREFWKKLKVQSKNVNS